MHTPDAAVDRADGSRPEDEAVLAGSIGPALLMILDTLAPAERLAFVLHDMFAVPRGARPALVDGAAGAVWTVHGQPRVVFAVTIAHGRVAGIEMIGDPVRLSELDLVFPAD